ncbi:MAG: DUF433 domain-containing protein [Dehalococcoidia bacterium]
MTTETLAEEEKMRRAPGIIFADGPSGRRARIADTGLDVFEIIKEYLARGRKWERLTAGFHWLTEEQLQAALAYYERFPEEIDARLDREAAITPEYIRAKYPLSRHQDSVRDR